MNRGLLSVVALSASIAAGSAYGVPSVYIPLGSANEVVAVNAATDNITATYKGFARPHGLVATPNGKVLIAGSLRETRRPGGAPASATSKLYLLRPGQGHRLRTVTVTGWTHHQAITPDGRYVISTQPTQGGVDVLDLRSDRVTHVIKTGPLPNYTAITKDGRTAYVTNSGNGTVSRIDLKTWKVTGTLQGGPTPEHLVLSPDQKTLYIANPSAGTVSAVSTRTGKVTRSFRIGKGVHGIDFGDRGKILFVSAVKANEVVALNPVTGAERTLHLGPAPYMVDTIRGTGTVYVSSRKVSKVWVIDQKTFRVVDTIALPGGHGHQMAVVP